MNWLTQQFVRAGKLDGLPGDQLAPDPMMMPNNAGGVEVRAVVQRMAIGDHHDVVMM